MTKKNKLCHEKQAGIKNKFKFNRRKIINKNHLTKVEIDKKEHKILWKKNNDL